MRKQAILHTREVALHCRIYVMNEVRSRSFDQTPSLPGTLAVLREGMAAGLHIGAQWYVSRDGRCVADEALGESRPGVAMSQDTLIFWLSATKPVAAVAIGQLWEQDRLQLDDAVARHIPEFAVKGKESITIRHILTHTCGFRWLETGWPQTPWDEIIAKICAMPIERGWIPAQRAGYHPMTSWFILGEIVRRADGRPFERYVREEIFEPLEMRDSWIGMPAERWEAYGDRIGILQQTDKQPIQPLPGFDTEAAATNCRPAANGMGPIRELGCFYEALLAGGALAGRRILRPETVRAFTTRQRIGMFDETFKHVIDWGLGFIVNSNRYGIDTVPYGFGPYAGEETFGHNGKQSSSAFADPEHDLVVAIVCNGTPGEVAHDRRMRAIHSAIYQDLGLTKP